MAALGEEFEEFAAYFCGFHNFTLDDAYSADTY
jgi:hypothetical protein